MTTQNDLRKAFVSGVKWWDHRFTGKPMWVAEVMQIEAEAKRRYPDEVKESKTFDKDCDE